MVAPQLDAFPAFSSFLVCSLLLFHDTLMKTRLITMTRALLNRTQRSHGTLHSSPDVNRTRGAFYFIL